jgi:hypothetical protein
MVGEEAPLAMTELYTNSGNTLHVSYFTCTVRRSAGVGRLHGQLQQQKKGKSPWRSSSRSSPSLVSGSATATGGHEPLTDAVGHGSQPPDRRGRRVLSGWLTSHRTGPTPPLSSTSGGVILQAPHLQPVADAERALVELTSLAPGDPVPPRQCGRCRLMFDADPTLYPPARPDWWVCPPCRAILFGRHPAPNAVRPRRNGDRS